jgi:hypothetical protein
MAQEEDVEVKMGFFSKAQRGGWRGVLPLMRSMLSTVKFPFLLAAKLQSPATEIWLFFREPSILRGRRFIPRKL